MKRLRIVATIICTILIAQMALITGGSALAISTEYSDPDIPIEVEVGQEFTIRLESNTTTGYQWLLAEPLDGNILARLSFEYQAPTTDRLGEGGREIWTFWAAGPGETTISLEYVRPWEEDTPPAGTATFTVVVNPSPEEETLWYNDPDIPIEVDIGQEFIITLESNATTGYRWQLAPLDRDVLVLVDWEYEAPKAYLMGVGGREIRTFRAVGSGETTIRLGYVRPWEDTPPSMSSAFTITVRPAYGGEPSVEYSEPAIPFEVDIGQEFTISLESNASTGYQWRLADTLDGGILMLVSSEYEAPETDLPGAPGRELWTFKAIGKGETNIPLEYIRPWEEDVPPVDSKTFIVIVGAGYSDPNIPIEVEVGRRFTISLESNATTGYQWKLAPPDEDALMLVHWEYEVPETDLVGAGGRELWTFKAVGQGEATILLGYVRPWEADTPPAMSRAFTVIIANCP